MDSKDMKIGDCCHSQSQIYLSIYTPHSTRKVKLYSKMPLKHYKKLLIIWYLAIDFLDRHLVYSHCFIIILPFSELGRLFECMFLQLDQGLRKSNRTTWEQENQTIIRTVITEFMLMLYILYLFGCIQLLLRI